MLNRRVAHRSAIRKGPPHLFGVPVRRAYDAAELRRELAAAFAADGPVAVEAIVDSREYDGVVLKKDKG